MKAKESITLGEIANTSNAITSKGTSFVDTIKALQNYAGPFKLQYNVQ